MASCNLRYHGSQYTDMLCQAEQVASCPQMICIIKCWTGK